MLDIARASTQGPVSARGVVECLASFSVVGIGCLPLVGPKERHRIDVKRRAELGEDIGRRSARSAGQVPEVAARDAGRLGKLVQRHLLSGHQLANAGRDPGAQLVGAGAGSHERERSRAGGPYH